MSRAGLARAQEFSWERVTAKVDDYYGFVIRRLAARGALPASFHAADPALAPGVPVAGDRRPASAAAGARPAARASPSPSSEPTPAARG